jgi:hypothetical protein
MLEAEVAMAELPANLLTMEKRVEFIEFILIICDARTKSLFVV